jgi:hypothetical protein
MPLIWLLKLKSQKFGLKFVCNQVDLKENLHFVKKDPKIEILIKITVFHQIFWNFDKDSCQP